MRLETTSPNKDNDHNDEDDDVKDNGNDDNYNGDNDNYNYNDCDDIGDNRLAMSFVLSCLEDRRRLQRVLSLSYLKIRSVFASHTPFVHTVDVKVTWVWLLFYLSNERGQCFSTSIAFCIFALTQGAWFSTGGHLNTGSRCLYEALIFCDMPETNPSMQTCIDHVVTLIIRHTGFQWNRKSNLFNWHR